MQKQREKNPTTWEIICDASNSTRYNRQNESKNLLVYVYGGIEGALLGAWDLISHYASAELVEKKGKWIEKLYGKFSSSYQKSDQCMNQALATKYKSHLSRRKYAFSCKIQSSTFDAENQKWSNKAWGSQHKSSRKANFSPQHTEVCQQP